MHAPGLATFGVTDGLRNDSVYPCQSLLPTQLRPYIRHVVRELRLGEALGRACPSAAEAPAFGVWGEQGCVELKPSGFCWDFLSSRFGGG